jgi:ribonuclease J
VLRDRRVLAEEGIVVTVVTVDRKRGELVGDPEIVSRGFLSEPGHEDITDEVRTAVQKTVEIGLGEGKRDPEAIRRLVRRTVGRLVNERTRRRPMIVVVVVEV